MGWYPGKLLGRMRGQGETRQQLDELKEQVFNELRDMDRILEELRVRAEKLMARADEFRPLLQGAGKPNAEQLTQLIRKQLEKLEIEFSTARATVDRAIWNIDDIITKGRPSFG